MPGFWFTRIFFGCEHLMSLECEDFHEAVLIAVRVAADEGSRIGDIGYEIEVPIIGKEPPETGAQDSSGSASL